MPLKQFERSFWSIYLRHRIGLVNLVRNEPMDKFTNQLVSEVSHLDDEEPSLPRNANRKDSSQQLKVVCDLNMMNPTSIQVQFEQFTNLLQDKPNYSVDRLVEVLSTFGKNKSQKTLSTFSQLGRLQTPLAKGHS